MSSPPVVEPGADAPPLVERILRPVHEFGAMAAAGGLVLVGCAFVALVVSNSRWAAAYHDLWEIPLTIGVPNLALTLSLHEWINDGLMAVFFLLVGLEIKREVLVGELASRRSAILPVAAAVGGMLVPALIYSLLNRGGPGASGWGVPMATDIAFALGILALLGNRAPVGLRIFLTALAIADDLGAVLVIAAFYSGTIEGRSLAGAALTLAVLFGLNRAGVRRPLIYGLCGIVLWLLVLDSGVHASVAGVLLALAIPARTRISEPEFLARAETSLARFRASNEPGTTVLTNQGHQEALQALSVATDQAQAPLQRIESALHGPVSFLIVPLFALANAGLALDSGIGRVLLDPVAVGVIGGLLIGKPLAVMLASFIVVRTGLADLPKGTTWRHLHGAGWLAGIGFTMSLFIADLAFTDPELLATAKSGILVASLAAGLVGSVLLLLAEGSEVEGVNVD